MKWRIFAMSLAITLISVLVFGFYSAKVYYNSSVDDGKNYLRVYMNEFDDEKYPLNDDGARAFSEKLNGTRVTFMDVSGQVIADSAAVTQNDHSNRKEIVSAIESGEGFSVRASSTVGKNMIYFCKNFNGEYLVRIAIFTDSGLNIFVKTLPTLASFLAVMVALCVLVAAVSTGIVVKPVKKLAKEAAGFEPVTSKYAELKPVADILNARNDDIKRQLDEINREKELVLKARASKDEFISNVTHEMNTPLTSIRGYAELLSANVMTDEQKAIAYKTILTQSERLTNLITCIINYSEIETENLPPYDVDFSAIAKETLCALKPEADKRNIKIIENIEDNVILLSRHQYLSEIFGNLVRNAIKYNKDGGEIYITLNENELIVKDTGVGIAEENMNKVFSRFFTVDKSHGGKNGGFGLGLAVVKKICDKQGYKISVESVIDNGSTFTVKFK